MPQQVPIMTESEKSRLSIANNDKMHDSESKPNPEPESYPDDKSSVSEQSRETNKFDIESNNENTTSNNQYHYHTKPAQQQTETSNNDSSNSSKNIEQKLATSSSSSPVIDSSSADTIASRASTKAAPAKLNGLKNRIIQRPPPLVLDKVSNFYDNETSGCIAQTAQTNIAQASISDSTSADQSRNEQSKLKPFVRSMISQLDVDRSVEPSTNNNVNVNSANQKFWASLNENASRNRALANARAAVNNTTNVQNYQEINYEESNPSNGATDALGADLIIKHKTSRVASNRSQKKTFPRLSTRTHTSESEDQSHDGSLHHQSAGIRQRDTLTSYNDQDDGTGQSEHGGSVRGGGNLIGVNSSTPPVVSLLDSHNNDEMPLSASSSRSRSNNPFIDNDDEDDGFVSDSRIISRKQLESNFHKRPASFIAATSSERNAKASGPSGDNLNVANGQKLEHGLQNLNLTSDKTQDEVDYRNTGHTMTSKLEYDSIYMNQSQPGATTYGSGYPSILKTQAPALYRLPHDNRDPSNYNTNRNRPHEQEISIDSEKAILQPPPSATMQLPHWTDAIYELNNAILDTNSVAGGAENGQFIFIVESGDIILELDKIKVSGFTLIEFNGLVESKQFHLLNAVQTKHSYGLTHDLKLHLNQSFAKNSKDRNLQNLIRENIYRRTIPCTTRPPRPGEKDKVDYHFLTKEKFVDLNRRGMLLECGVFSDHYYGTLKPMCDLNVLSVYQSPHDLQSVDDLRQIWDANHPAIDPSLKKEFQQLDNSHPLYENHQSIQMSIQKQHSSGFANGTNPSMNHEQNPFSNTYQNATFADSDILPSGWERISDPTYGTYYIDHNTRRTQYEKPYEVELTKGSMGFGFTLVEADNGMLLVRSIIQGGPAHINGFIKPGDILMSAVGISVTGLQHTDVARLFSTFAVGDRVRLTFARSNFIPENIVPDEFLFSNGTNGDLAVAINPKSFHPYVAMQPEQGHQIVVDQEFEYLNLSLQKGERGFGFTISDSMAGQKVRKIQNNEACANLRQGDILMSMNDEDITSLTHKEVVERLKNCPVSKDVRLTVKRKKRFRSKTPMAMHTDAAANGEYSLDSTPQRNCKTPSLDGLMLMRPANHNSSNSANASRPLFHNQPTGSQLYLPTKPPQQSSTHISSAMQPINMPINYTLTGPPLSTIPRSLDPNEPVNGTQYAGLNGIDIYNSHITTDQSNHKPTFHSNQGLPTEQGIMGSNQSTDENARDDMSNSAQASDSCMPLNSNYNLGAMNQYVPANSYISSNVHQIQPTYQTFQAGAIPTDDYYPLPLYSNSEIINGEYMHEPSLPVKPNADYPMMQSSYFEKNAYQDNYYANNEEIAMQNVQFSDLDISQQQRQQLLVLNNGSMSQPMIYNESYQSQEEDQADDYEYHHVDLERENSESNWGIRLIGGAEVERVISIGSIVFGGAASKNGQLKSGDEIMSINGINVVGATHQHVVELISTCTNRASLVVRRKRFAEACDVVLTRNMDEGFGFVIISSGNCALIGRIIEGSPADRCKQLHVRDRIIAVNGRYITSNMRHPQIVSMIKECGSTLKLRIIPVDCYTVELIKSAQNDNFGFSIRGGSEYDGTPLYILRVAPNGLARDLLNVGDQILEINNIPTVGMTHHQAATIIKYSDPIVKLKLRRNYVTPASLLVDSPRELQKFNQVTAEMIAVNQNATPSQNGSLTTVQQIGGSSTAIANPDLMAADPELNSIQSGALSTIHPTNQQDVQHSSSLTSELNQNSTTQATSSSSLPYENQSQPLYAA